MTLCDRKIVSILKGHVCYERIDEPSLVIYRTVAEHREATGTEPVVGQVVTFEMCVDYDGSSNSFHKPKG